MGQVEEGEEHIKTIALEPNYAINVRKTESLKVLNRGMSTSVLQLTPFKKLKFTRNAKFSARYKMAAKENTKDISFGTPKIRCI